MLEFLWASLNRDSATVPIRCSKQHSTLTLRRQFLDNFRFRCICAECNVLYFCATCPFHSIVNSKTEFYFFFTQFFARAHTHTHARPKCIIRYSSFSGTFLFLFVGALGVECTLFALCKWNFNWKYCVDVLSLPRFFLCLFQSGERTIRNKHYFIFTNVKHAIF